MRVHEPREPGAAYDHSLRAESLDFEPVANAVSAALRRRQDGRRRHLYGYTGETLAKWVATVASGGTIGVSPTPRAP